MSKTFQDIAASLCCIHFFQWLCLLWQADYTCNSYTCHPVFTRLPLVENWIILLEQSFASRLPLLTALAYLDCGKVVKSSRWCYIHRLIYCLYTVLFVTVTPSPYHNKPINVPYVHCSQIVALATGMVSGIFKLESDGKRFHIFGWKHKWCWK